MPIRDCIGQNQAKRMISNALSHDRVSHAYLFYGPKGTGKLKMALSFAQALFCSVHTDDACGECANCRRITNGNHPDVYCVQAEGNTIKIDQIRQLQKDISYRASESKRKVYIIEGAERMTHQAANSLLKFLEEPSSGVTAILTTENRHILLSTILSRVQLIPFFPVSKEEMNKYLLAEEISEPIARAVCQMVAGLEEGKQLCRSESFAQVRNVVIQLMKETLNQSSNTIIYLHEKWFKTDRWEEQLDLFLDFIVYWLRDIAHAKNKRLDHIVFIDQLELIRNQSFRWSLMQIVQAIEHVLETKKRLRAHANVQLTLERLFIKLQEG
jgi:DNA polymerase-3 subunit delta'